MDVLALTELILSTLSAIATAITAMAARKAVHRQQKQKEKIELLVKVLIASFALNFSALCIIGYQYFTTTTTKAINQHIEDNMLIQVVAVETVIRQNPIWCKDGGQKVEDIKASIENIRASLVAGMDETEKLAFTCVKVFKSGEGDFEATLELLQKIRVEVAEPMQGDKIKDKDEMDLLKLRGEVLEKLEEVRKQLAD